jgi:hypothetical protein
VTSVITVFDHVIPLPGPLWQLALTTNEHIFLEQIIHSLELTNRCLLAGADRHCFGWYGTHQLILGQPLQGRDGYSINLQMTARYTSVSIPQGESEQPPSQRTPAATHHHPARAEQVIRNASFERDREETPTASTPLSLDTLIPVYEVAKVKAADPAQPLPHYIEIPKDSAEPGVAQELKQRGLTSPVYAFGECGDFLYYNIEETDEASGIHYMLCHDDLQDEQGSILHTDDKILSDQEIMSLLHRMDYERAVVLSHEMLLLRLRRVRFWNCKPTQQSEDSAKRCRTAWPARPAVDWTQGPLFNFDLNVKGNCPPSCFVDTPFTSEDIQELLQAGNDALCTDFTGLDLPPYIEEALTSTVPGDLHDHWDRLLIFTDGSSQTKNKHFTPEFADAMTMPDTWAMLVLGERYTTASDSVIIPIGWAAHPVRTDPLGSCFAGSTRIGADIAEREGVLWAGIWRLTLNQITPTVFCVDSQITSGQADGTIGVADPDTTFRLLRGTFRGFHPNIFKCTT